MGSRGLKDRDILAPKGEMGACLRNQYSQHAIGHAVTMAMTGASALMADSTIVSTVPPNGSAMTGHHHHKKPTSPTRVTRIGQQDSNAKKAKKTKKTNKEQTPLWQTHNAR